MNEKGGFETQNKSVEYDNITYLLNDEENTAGIIRCKKNLRSIIIPTTINHESKEYYVTSILTDAFEFSNAKQIQFYSDSKLQKIEKNAFSFSKIESIKIPSSVISIGENAFCSCDKLENIEIPDDSKLQVIDKEAFSNTKIKSIRIPSELVELKEGWCKCTQNLAKISVSPNNPRYFCYEDEMIIGKSRIEQSNYDLLVFCVRDIQQIKIPNFIEHICSYSFNYCEKLESIEFSDDSKLKTIDKNAFYYSTVKSIRIPSDLVELKEKWCRCTRYLSKISVSPKNPRYCLFDGKMIIGKSRIEQSNYDLLVFCARDIQQIKIPNFIEHICPFAFESCNQLESIEFSNDSKLQTINKNAFSDSAIKNIRIPSSVTSIGENAFHYCYQLENIEIPDDSKLQVIHKEAFYELYIERIRIPSELVELKNGWCSSTLSLTEISVSPKNPRYFCYEDKMIIGKSRIEQSNYDLLVFCVRDIQQIKIPNFIEHICSYSFNYCEKLESIEFSNYSKLQTIDECAFLFSLIRRIRIPSSVTSIGEMAFEICDQLEVVEFPDDSKLQIIDNKAFSNSNIKSFRIPSSVTSIGEGAFHQCYHLQIIEVTNTEMIFMYQTAFIKCTGVLLMIPVHS